jgi:ferrochelatase
MSAARTGILLLQLGTPDSPSTADVRRYLAEFLWDRRVVDLPRPLWWAILNLRVLRTRPAASARLYKKVWAPEGSPLLTITQAQADGVRAALEGRYPDQTRIAVAMRYGNPSVPDAVHRLLADGCDRLLAVPMYPQYASATTGSSLEKLFDTLAPRRFVRALRVVPPYYEEPAYIDALVKITRESLGDWTPDHVVLSFHGVPKRYVSLGDPYYEHCLATAAAVRAAAGWAEDRVTVSFQSLFGKEEWLRPYTNETLVELAKRKIGKLAILCPGFTADCLETIEEIGMTNRELYHESGGGEYRLVPCLNDHPSWIDGLAGLVERELQGWLT